jgi:hypothetical protein
MASRRSSQLSYSRTAASLPRRGWSGGGGFEREARCMPGLDAADDVAGAETEAMEGGGGEAGLVPLVADQDDARVEAGEGWVAVLAQGSRRHSRTLRSTMAAAGTSPSRRR